MSEKHTTNLQYPRLYRSQSSPLPPQKQNVQVHPAFRHAKKEYPNSLLILRMGDWRYEAYYEDAAICSKVLGFEVETRHKSDRSFSVVGLPINQFDNWSKSLIASGYRLVIAEDKYMKVITPGSDCN